MLRRDHAPGHGPLTAPTPFTPFTQLTPLTPLVPRTLDTAPLPAVLTPPGTGPELWQLRLAEHRASIADGYAMLDAAERTRYASYRKPDDRDLYATAHIGLRRLLGGYLGRDPAAVVFGREPCPLCVGPHGRPYVPGADLHFSLAHSGDLVLFAFAATPVGVDVERLVDLAVADEISTVLHPRERVELSGVAAADRPAAFARCWCRKEAYLKGTGTGLGVPAAESYVGAGPWPGHVPGWTLSDVTAQPGYAAAVALATTPPSHEATEGRGAVEP
ncbi:4'-phosphopantetheinyl transferase family protein [Streptomyces sp. NBC_00503]|uniref:4'-phosphopantetheinyl transferase family protein n=1 Tax=Streptomyces sp. NBC_00503 TaxID=2903659 RepID=UPI002E815B2F|nr:4'-phosphopantetheinyl transferase superfamily protein [Streptomyces sp. NBC_00503]WUD82795.1 4'-phosphopantetheinyl transferase superfamily protein [Streptomyces sp. NBC_00503]